MTLNVGGRGARVTMGAPGTGLSYSHELAPPPERVLAGEPSHNAPALLNPPADRNGHEIRSVPPHLMTRGALSDFRDLLQQAGAEHRLAAQDLQKLEPTAQAAIQRAAAWNRGWLLRRLMPRKAQRLQIAAQEAEARLAELRTQMDLCKVQAQIEMPAEVAAPYRNLVACFDRMASSAAIWDTVVERQIDQVAERTLANRAVDRLPVAFELAACQVIDFAEPVPCLRNRNGGDLYLFPGFVVVFSRSESFAVVELGEIELRTKAVGFAETDQVPAGAEQIGETWLFANKDGSPDKRFRDNRPLPVLRYATIAVGSRGGLKEEWLLSSANDVLAFGEAWSEFARLVADLA